MERASGLISITELTRGPLLSIASILFKYNSVMDRDVRFPFAISSCKPRIVASFNSKLSPASMDFVSPVVSFFSSDGLQEAKPSVVMAMVAADAFLRKFLRFIGLGYL